MCLVIPKILKEVSFYKKNKLINQNLILSLFSNKNKLTQLKIKIYTKEAINLKSKTKVKNNNNQNKATR